MPIVMQPVKPESISIADPILMQAYNSAYSFREELEFYLRLQPDGWFFALDGGRPVGMGGAVNYGAFGYIGLIAVLPELQRHGVGALMMEYLLDWLVERACYSARLVATNAGAGLYSKLGFVEDDTTISYRLEQIAKMPFTTARGAEHVFVLRAEDLDQLVAFDTSIFAAERRIVLASYLSDLSGRCLAIRSPRGEITGYIVAQRDALGPWLARTPDEARVLLDAALTFPFEQAPTLRIYTSNTAAFPLLTSRGFHERRTFKHMYYGSKEPRQHREQLYALASAAIG